MNHRDPAAYLDVLIVAVFLAVFCFGVFVGLLLAKTSPVAKAGQVEEDDNDPADYWKRGEPPPDWS